MKYVFAVLMVGLIGVVIYDQFTIEQLNQELSAARALVSNNHFTSKPKRFVKRGTEHNKFFSFLHDINQGNKKIRYTQGELIVEDFALAQNDVFLDLLDYLFESNQLIMIEIPKKNKNIREDLKVAGFFSDFMTDSKDDLWRIKIKL